MTLEMNGIFAERLEGKKNVVGAGFGFKNGNPEDVAIVVLVSNKMPLESLAVEDLVPEYIGGVQTDVLEVGEIRAAPPTQATTGKFRPAPGGVSLGHFEITAGTLGVAVRSTLSGDRLILSNNHVLAKTNDAKIGAIILQPGAYDGGRLGEDDFAKLVNFVPIHFAGAVECPVVKSIVKIVNSVVKALGYTHRLQAYQAQQEINVVDAAIAKPLKDSDLMDDILDIGRVVGTTTASLGMKVRKHGRTTDYTEGTVVVIGATISVGYGDKGNAQFEDQILFTPMSAGGDSGSLIVALEEQKAVALLFAGSDQITIGSPINEVFKRLRIVLA